MYLRLVVLAGLAVFFCASPTQHVYASTPTPLVLSTTLRPNNYHVGEVATVQIDATISPGWHLYSLIPVSAPGPAATTISVTTPGVQLASRVTEDTPQYEFDDNFGKEVSFHTQHATFLVPLRVLAGAMGKRSVSLSFGYQVCNDRVCLPPSYKQLTFDFDVVPGPVRDKYRFAQTLPLSPQSIFFYAAAAFGAGLLALLTPCVFPLIPITFSSFIKQSGGNRLRLTKIAGSYSLGIIGLYVAIGLVTTVLLGATGISRIASSPWVNLFAFFVFVIFALSFFEVVEIRLPGNLGELQKAAKKQGGWLGLAALGVVFVLASFTCTAPFVGTLLVSAAGGSLLQPLIGMLCFSIAFVLPFLVFSAFPHWISQIPQSGLWLVRVKATIGFIELAAALKFLSNADLVWQWHIFNQSVILAAWASIFIAAALYLLGILQFGITAEETTKHSKISFGRIVVSFCFIFAAAYCFWGLSGRSINPYIAAYLPPNSSSSSIDGGLPGMPWLSDYGTALEAARQESKPLLIDFTGYTCTNCRLNEKQVFPVPSVQKAFSKYVLVQLYTDGGPNAISNSNLELSKFGNVALPLYGVINPQTQQVVASTAGIQSVTGFTKFLTDSEGVNATGSSSWQPFNSQIQSTKPSIIDFTASWCTNCKAIERNVFTDPRVETELTSFATYRSDLSDFYSPKSSAIEQKYGIASLPAIVFLDKSGKEIPGTRVSGLISADQFLERMNKAALL